MFLGNNFVNFSVAYSLQGLVLQTCSLFAFWANKIDVTRSYVFRKFLKDFLGLIKKNYKFFDQAFLFSCKHLFTSNTGGCC